MIYTIVTKDKRFGLDAKDIDDVRRWIYWHEDGGRFDIYKGKRLMGTMRKGTCWWGYEPDTGYGRDYEVLSNGAIRNDEWRGY